MSINDNNNLLVEFKTEPIDLLRGVKFVSSPKCGAINTFSGTVRDTEVSLTTGAPELVDAIHYEAYKSMANKQIIEILSRAIGTTKCGLVDTNCRAYAAIRLGRVPVQEASIVICVSSTNRLLSHEATMTILEQIKSLVVIWKKIIYQDGREEWSVKSEALWLSDP